MKKYVIDTNIFIYLVDYYPKEVFPTIFNKLSAMKEQLIYFDIVKEELIPNPGGASLHSKEASLNVEEMGLTVIKIDNYIEEISKQTIDIIQEIKALSPIDKNLFGYVAEYKENTKLVAFDRKLRNACNKFGVPVLTHIEFFKELNMKF